MTPSVKRALPAVALPALAGVGLSALTSLLVLRLSEPGPAASEAICFAAWLVGAAALAAQGVVGWLLLCDGRDSGGER